MRSRDEIPGSDRGSETSSPVPTAIRAAEKRDLPAILNLYVQSGLDRAALPLERAESIFERMRQYPDYRIYVAECDGQLVGTFALLIMDNLGHLGARSGVVEDVAVSPAWRRRGIGGAMMRFAMERYQEAGCYKLALSSNLGREEAHAFYRSLAFERHGYSFRVESPS